MRTLALDIGGANIKAAYRGESSGKTTAEAGETASVSFALWKNPGGLPEKLAEVAARFRGFDRILVTMTAELCDCFETKRAGVNHVLDAVEGLAKGNGAKPRAAVGVWTTEGRFVSSPEARAEPIKAAASNWHALATFVAKLYPDDLSLLVDMGSTTTDIIKLRNGKPDVMGLTDTERLASGELLYFGVIRTPLMALGPMIEWRGRFYHVMAEYFATTLDLFTLTGEFLKLKPDADTADGRSITKENAAARVLRMIGADLDMLTVEDAREIAEVFLHVARMRIAKSIGRVMDGTARNEEDPRVSPISRLKKHRAAPESAKKIGRVIVSGSGTFFAIEVVDWAFPADDRLVLSDRTGVKASEAACAYALVQMADRT